MLTNYQMFAIGQFGVFLIFPVIVMLIYWRSSLNEVFYEKILVSSQGIFLLVSCVYAISVSPYTNVENWRSWALFYDAIFILFSLSSIYTLIKFKGNKNIHLLQALLIPNAGIIWLIGGMTLTHDWL